MKQEQNMSLATSAISILELEKNQMQLEMKDEKKVDQEERRNHVKNT